MTIHGLRKYLSWLFAFTALVCLQISISLPPAILRQHPHATQLSFTYRLLLPMLPWIFPFATVVFAMAWWTSFKAKPSARVWGILASLINVQTALVPILFPPHSLFNAFLPILALGIAGLVAFARPINPAVETVKADESPALPGDGTNNLLNKALPLLILVAGGAGFRWWLNWIVEREVVVPHTNSYLFVMAVLLSAVIVTLHELGHTAVGLSLGMKLRAFIVGPFQWRIQDGRWRFQFQPAQLLFGSGATGIVPAAIDFPRWAYICMLLGGIGVNTVTGVAALGVAFANDPDAQVQAGGLLALFGVWSLTAAAVNLIPFRIQNYYSDGAQIHQLLANSVWADLHRAFGVVGASLVTPVRPRDYDIETIVRASSVITQGAHGLVLRLLAYTHFLDQGDFARAGEELTQAGLIYNQSATNIPGDLLAVFVFGTGLIWRNAEGTRAWWMQMEGKKGIRFNAEYWLAASALAWVEGNLKSANEALGKATSLADQLPRAGAYEFERHCCRLLRDALREVPIATTSA